VDVGLAARVTRVARQRRGARRQLQRLPERVLRVLGPEHDGALVQPLGPDPHLVERRGRAGRLDPDQHHPGRLRGGAQGELAEPGTGGHRGGRELHRVILLRDVPRLGQELT